ncbi:MAG: hypothetical protein CL959_04635 [Euryarchaeota archaeon]|nr:hypothetical protein [Euryarchaeota archaeon]|tara:strand:+ start:348 stop:743 length:396 start_codon:yes stop_codon:yes gene_type:complete
MNNTANNLQDLLSLRGCGEETFGQLKRNVYKYTSCGAWIIETEYGVGLGSIVEGVDEGTETHALNYPFTIDQFQDALQSVEDEADEIWKATHGCEDCHDHPQADEWGNENEFGAWPINPDCKTCKGEGAII